MKKIKLAIVTASAATLLMAGAAYAAPPNQTPGPTTQAPAPGKQGQARGGYGDLAHGNAMMQAGPRGQQGLFHGKVSAIVVAQSGPVGFASDARVAWPRR